ncbi:YbgC/FadM family acyl-CoA thioesterase [Alistipes dispar]
MEKSEDKRIPAEGTSRPECGNTERRGIRVFRGFDALPRFVRPVVTVGSYDGVHLGHRALIDRLTAEARAVGGESVVLTFDPHPRITLGRGEGLRLLTTLDEKVALLRGLGVDNVIVIPFDRTFSALSGEEFARRYLIGKVGAETLVAGYDHRFGHDRIDCDRLAALGMRVIRVDERSVEGEHVSSTAIRRLVEAGRIAEAERLLGHRFRAAVQETPATADRMRGEARRIRPKQRITKRTTTMLSHDCKIRVWYKHTDQMAICHHSNYICYYEAARSELLRELGMSFAEVERRGIMMPILEVQSKYRKPAYFDELLTVRIILREKPAARINFFYEIYNERGELINTGMTQLGFIHSDTRRPCRCPEWFLALLDTRWQE